eukprot:9474278-Pyramimonas_sp.AAC.1
MHHLSRVLSAPYWHVVGTKGPVKPSHVIVNRCAVPMRPAAPYAPIRTSACFVLTEAVKLDYNQTERSINWAQPSTTATTATTGGQPTPGAEAATTATTASQSQAAESAAPGETPTAEASFDDRNNRSSAVADPRTGTRARHGRQAFVKPLEARLRVTTVQSNHSF